MKKLLLILSFLFLPVFAQAQFTVPQGGTGLTSVPAGQCLKGSTTLHLTTGTCGGGSGGGTWSTTTSSVAGQLFNYPNNNTDVVLIGNNSSTTAPFWWDPNVRQFYLNGIGTTTQVFTAPYFAATSTIATSSLPITQIGTRLEVGSPGWNGATQSGNEPALNVQGVNNNCGILIGDLCFEGFGLNNNFFGDNFYYDNISFKARKTGSAGIFYFQGGSTEEGQFRMGNSSVTLGNTITFVVPAKFSGANGGTFVGGGNINTATGNFTGATIFATTTELLDNQNLRVIGKTMFNEATGTVLSETLSTTTNQYISSVAKPAGQFLAADMNGQVIGTTSPSSASSTLLGDQNLFTGASTTVINLNSVFSTTTNLVVSNAELIGTTTPNAPFKLTIDGQQKIYDNSTNSLVVANRNGTTRLVVSGADGTITAGGTTLNDGGNNLLTGGGVTVGSLTGGATVCATLSSAGQLGRAGANCNTSGASSTLLADSNLFTGASSTVINFNAYNSTSTFATTTSLSVLNTATTSQLFVNNATTTTSYAVTASSTNGYVSQNLVVSGNVGIGTTSPYARLTVGGQAVAAYFTATTSNVVQPSAFKYVTVGSPTVLASGTPEMYIEGSTTAPTLGVGTVYTQSFGKGNGWIAENETYDGTQFRAVATGNTEQVYFQNGELQMVVSNSTSVGAIVSMVLPGKFYYGNGGTGALGGNCSTGVGLVTGCTLVATGTSVTVNGGLSVTGDTRLTQATSTGFTTTTICLTGDICRTTWPTVANSASTTLLGDQNLFTGASTTVSNKFNFGSFAATSTAYGPVIHATSSAITTENIVATSSTTNIDWGKGNQQNVRIGTAAITINFGDYVAGQSLRLIVCNPTGGTAGTITWDPKVLWSGGTVPTQTTTANHCDIWSFVASNGTSTLQVLGGGNITNF